MFRESLLENCTDCGARRRWTTLTSFALQIAAACLCVVLPLFYPEALPLMHANAEILMPPPSGGPPRPVDVTVVHQASTPALDDNPLVIHEPRRVPDTIDTTADPRTRTADTFPSGPYVDGAVPGNDAHHGATILSELLNKPALHPTLKPPSKPLRVSELSQGLLLNRVEPRYPEIPRRAHIEGDVVLAAIIGRDGRIENLHLISGHPLLAPAALDAVKQWRYRPYMLGTEAVEVETQITVRFRLNVGQ